MSKSKTTFTFRKKMFINKYLLIDGLLFSKWEVHTYCPRPSSQLVQVIQLRILWHCESYQQQQGSYYPIIPLLAQTPDRPQTRCVTPASSYLLEQSVGIST